MIMARYIGYSTLNTNVPRTIARNVNDMPSLTTNPYRSGVSGKKFTLTDEKLVIADLINALNIKQGDKVGQPGYGTTIWSYVFEQNTASVREQIETELRRVISADPRIDLNAVTLYSYENGVQLEVELAVNGYSEPLSLNIDLNRNTGRAGPIVS
jgi:phage baseplate assembly protein W